MIPILYESSETEFVSEGLGRLSDAISCSVTEERNGSYELEMEYPVTGVHYNDIQLKRIISAIPADGKNRQSFVIYKISRPLDGKVTINAYHISYLLSGVITAPGSAKTVSEALLLLKNNALTDCPFTFWTDKGTVANYSCDVPASIRSRLGGVTGSILDCYGGEYEWDNFTVKLHSHRGQDNGVRIAYGKNLTDIKQEESIESTVIGVYPYWKKDASDVEEAQLVTLDAPVYADNADNFPYKLVSVLDCSQEWQTAPTTDQLKAYAQSYIKNNDVGVPSVSIDVAFVALWQTEEYKNIAPLERVNLCDTVHVDFNTLGVSATAKVIKTDYDVLSERYNSITIGDAKSSLSSTISNLEKNVEQNKKDSTSFMQTAIANATKLIQGGLGGHVIFNTNADGQPNEILIMDTDDKNTAVNVLRINMNGIGFSQTGYNGPFETAWTIDGHFNAKYIDTGVLNASMIRAGIIQDSEGLNFWNLDTGEMSLSFASGKGTLASSKDGKGIAFNGTGRLTGDMHDQIWFRTLDSSGNKLSQVVLGIQDNNSGVISTAELYSFSGGVHMAGVDTEAHSTYNLASLKAFPIDCSSESDNNSASTVMCGSYSTYSEVLAGADDPSSTSGSFRSWLRIKTFADGSDMNYSGLFSKYSSSSGSDAAMRTFVTEGSKKHGVSMLNYKQGTSTIASSCEAWTDSDGVNRGALTARNSSGTSVAQVTVNSNGIASLKANRAYVESSGAAYITAPRVQIGTPGNNLMYCDSSDGNKIYIHNGWTYGKPVLSYGTSDSKSGNAIGLRWNGKELEVQVDATTVGKVTFH